MRTNEFKKKMVMIGLLAGVLSPAAFAQSAQAVGPMGVSGLPGVQEQMQAHEAEDGRFTLAERLRLEADIARAEAVERLNKVQPVMPAMPSMPAVSLPDMPSIAGVAAKTPQIKSIRGVGSNLRASMLIGNAIYDVAPGDVREGWKVVSVTTNSVRISKGGAVQEFSLAESAVERAGEAASGPTAAGATAMVR